MKLKLWQIGIMVIGGLVILGGGLGPLLPGAIYSNQWEVKANLGGVTVAGKGTALPEFRPTGWDARGSWGDQRIYADPDGAFKASTGLPNIEVEIGDIHSKYSWASMLGSWSKKLIQERVIEIGEDKQEYVVEEYTFEARIGSYADITHIHSFWGANDRFETETTYDKAGSIPGDQAEVTAWAVFQISPWELRGEDNEKIGAWIMKAQIDKVEIFSEQVEAYAKRGKHWETGKCIVLTNPGAANMFTDVKGSELRQYEFQEGVTPSSSMRTAVAIPVTVIVQPGYYYDSVYADEGELKYVPRDAVFVIKVEVLRTRNWRPEGTQIEPPPVEPPDDDQGEEGKEEWMFFDLLGPELTTLLILIGAAIVLWFTWPFISTIIWKKIL